MPASRLEILRRECSGLRMTAFIRLCRRPRTFSSRDENIPTSWGAGTTPDSAELHSLVLVARVVILSPVSPEIGTKNLDSGFFDVDMGRHYVLQNCKKVTL